METKLNLEVYAICDSSQPEKVRYVGMSTLGAAIRFKGHMKDARRGVKRPIALWLAKRLPGEVLLTVIETCRNEEELYAAEIKWIAHYRSLGMCDLNITDGGMGVPGMKHTEGWKKKQSSRSSGTKGYKHTAETRALMSEIGKKKFSDPQLLIEHAERIAKLTRQEVEEIKKRLWLGENQSTICKDFDTSFQNVSNISRGVSWKHVPWPIGPRPKWKQFDVASGEKSGNAKLDDDKVLEIRRLSDDFSGVELAKQFGVSRATICNIISRKTWKHLP